MNFINRMRNGVGRKVTAIGLALGIALGGGSVALANQYITPAVDGENVIISGCVIRFLVADDGRPSIHANGAHQCAGVTSVGIDNSGQVILNQSVTGPGDFPIIGAFCQADETVGGSRGVMCGASGGTGTTRFRLYDTKMGRTLNLRQQSDRHRIMSDVSNLWVMWVHAPVNP